MRKEQFVNIYAHNEPETLKSIILWAVVILFIGYQTINVFVPNEDMIIYVRVLDIAFTAVALVLFAPDAWLGIWRKVPKPRDFLIVGIWLKFFSAEWQSVNAVLYRLAGTPKWLLNNELLPWAIMVGIVAVVCHICTPGAVRKEGGSPAVPRRNFYALAISSGIAVLIVGLIIVNKPDIGPLMERIRPYIGDWWRTGFVPGGVPAAPPPA